MGVECKTQSCSLARQEYYVTIQVDLAIAWNKGANLSLNFFRCFYSIERNYCTKE